MAATSKINTDTTINKPILYYMIESPPCRTVIAVARLLKLDIELRSIDLSKNEQMNADFIRINPFHVVPTLQDDDGFILWESRAIVTYLVQKNRPYSNLYPSDDLKKRAIIDRFLQYDLGTYFRAISDVAHGIFQIGRLNLEKLPRLKEILETFESFLADQLGKNSDSSFLAGGNNLTLADISIYYSTTLLDVVPVINLATAYPSLWSWFNRVEDQLAKEVNQNGEFDKARENMKSFAKFLQENAAYDA